MVTAILWTTASLLTVNFLLAIILSLAAKCEDKVSKSKIFANIAIIAMSIAIVSTICICIESRSVKTINIYEGDYDIVKIADVYNAKEKDYSGTSYIKYQELWGIKEYTYYRAPIEVDPFEEYKITKSTSEE